LHATRNPLLPGVNYFQVVFTFADRFSPLILGNRWELYNLLFRSARQRLDAVLRQEGNLHQIRSRIPIEPAYWLSYSYSYSKAK
jgi:hypothetical protein